MKDIKLSVTTNGSGAGTATATKAVSGELKAVDYVPGTIDTGATITVTDEFNGISYTLWNKASAGTSNIRVYPRVAQVLNTDGSALAFYECPMIAGIPKLTVASGGATKTGYVILHYEEEG